MKLFYIFLIAFCFSTFGCGSTQLFQYHTTEPDSAHHHADIYPIYIDNTFSKEEVNTIVSVVNEWNNALNGYMVLKIEPRFIDHKNTTELNKLIGVINNTSEGLLILGLEHNNEIIKDTITEEDGVLAFVNALGDRAHLMVVIQDRIGHRDLHSILLHEFGHAMGAEHVRAPSLMYPSVGQKQLDCIDKITAAQVAGYHNLPLEHMRYCATPNFE